MLEQLKRPFKRHYEKYRSRLDGFVGPVKESASKLLAMLPKMEAFAGSEDLGQESDGSTSGGKPGLLAKLKDFKKSIKNLSDFQKLILLTIAVVLPAGILISVTIVVLLKHKK